jgi:hypothetical protein
MEPPRYYDYNGDGLPVSSQYYDYNSCLSISIMITIVAANRHPLGMENVDLCAMPSRLLHI